MLSWLKGDKVDHPLGSARELKRVVDALPGKDVLKTLEEVSYWLSTVNETDLFKVDQRFNVIDSLDEASRKAQERVRETYAKLHDEDPIQEKRTWKIATDFWNALAAAYMMCVLQAQDAKNVPGAFKARLPLLAARATQALRAQMHWILLRYGVLRPTFWTEMAQCARLVEAEGAIDKSLSLYSDSPAQSSQREEQMRAMMFWAASPSGLSPLEQDLGERLVAYLSPRFRMGAKPWNDCDYCFDLDAGRPPLRYGTGIPISAATRYFDGGDAWQTVQSLAATAASTRTPPPEIQWGAAADGPSVIRLLNHVGLNWSKQMPPRTHVRRRTAMRLLVMHGYQQVLGAIEPATSEGLDFSDTLAYDSWIAEDVSAGGYGVVAPAGKGEWLRVGVLVALRTETESSWDIGIVRRVKSDEHRQHRIGIQLISKAAVPVALRKASGAAAGGKRQSAILLSARISRSGSLHIVARRDLLGGREPLEATYGLPPKTVTLAAGGVVESGQDFDWLRYKLLENAV